MVYLRRSSAALSTILVIFVLLISCSSKQSKHAETAKPKLVKTMTITVNENTYSRITIPFTAVNVDAKDNHYVWIINPDNSLAEKRLVKVGQVKGDTIQIISGLNPNDMIVTDGGTKQITEGMKVQSITDIVNPNANQIP